MKILITASLVLVFGLLGIVAYRDRPQPRDTATGTTLNGAASTGIASTETIDSSAPAATVPAGVCTFAGGALTIDLPAGGVDASADAPAASVVSGFRFVQWPNSACWVASATMPALVMDRLFENSARVELSRETVTLGCGHEAVLQERDNVGSDGIADAWGLVLFDGDAAYEVSAGFGPVPAERAAARALVLSTRTTFETAAH